VVIKCLFIINQNIIFMVNMILTYSMFKLNKNIIWNMSISKLHIMYIVITSKVFIKNLSRWFKIIWRSYPAAKPVAPERDMMPVGVVVLLGAVKRGCREGRATGRKMNRNLRREQGVDEASSRAATRHSLKMWLSSSHEQVNPWTEKF
jgi:hypothetical protein